MNNDRKSMRRLKELQGRVVTNPSYFGTDRRFIGKLEDLTHQKQNIDKIIIDINEEALENVGKKKPELSPTRGCIPIEKVNVETMGDQVMLYEPLKNVCSDLQEISKEKVLSSLKGKVVSDRKKRVVGKVNYVLIDTENWISPAIVIKLEKEILNTLDIEESKIYNLELPVSMEHVERTSDQIMMDNAAEKMEEVIDKELINEVYEGGNA